MNKTLPSDWQAALGPEMAKPYFAALETFINDERAAHEVFPSDADVFNALRLTPLETVRVFILGQDPYHDTGQAHGLAFSVLPGVKSPPSLANIFREMKTDLDLPVPPSSTLTPWAEQGVLLLNAVLTVRAHQANSHKNKGWETFTDAVIQAVAQKSAPVVFVLWGAYAQKKIPLIEQTEKESGQARHTLIASAHPSPLSARNGFFGSRPLSRINAALEAAGVAPIDWRL